MKHKLISFFLVLFLILTAAVNVSASDMHLPRVVDGADLLSGTEESDLTEKIDSIVQNYDMDVVILTVNTLGSKSASAYADDYYDYIGYGIGSDHSGLLLLIAMEERTWAVSTCGDAIRTVTDYEVEEILQDVAGYLSDAEYYDAFDTFLDRVEAQYRTGIDREESDSGNNFFRFVIALVIGAVVALIVLLVMRGKMNTAKAQSGAGSYLTEGSYDLYRCQDIYLYSRTAKVRKAENNSSGSHRSSSGRSHGGSSGRF